MVTILKSRKLTLKIKVYVFLLFVVLSYIPLKSYSEERKVAIFFVNGMLNDFSDAIKYKNALVGLFHSEIKRNNIDYPALVYFFISYNEKLDLYSTLIEAGSQHDFDANQWKEFIDKFMITKRKDTFYNFTYDPIDTIKETIREKMLETLISTIISHIREDELKTNPNLQAFVKEYLEKIKQGYKILLVAHSQGNFFANDAYEAIVKDYPGYSDSIKIISIGTPDSYVAGDGEYVSLKGDIISKLVPKAKPGYIENEEEGANGHGWIDGYMGGNNTRNKIFRMIYDSIESFYEIDENPVDNPPQFNTVTLPSRVKAGAKIFFSGSVSDDKQLSNIQMKVKRITTQTIDIETLNGTTKNLNGYFFGGDTLINTGNYQVWLIRNR